MTLRIADLASNNTLVSRLLRSKAALEGYQIQVSSGKISQTYSGISADSERLVNLENTRGALVNYNDDNTVMNLRLDIASTTFEAMRTTINNFKGALDTYSGGATSDKGRVKDVQEWALRALKDMQGFLNTAADGRYIFGGAGVNKRPVDLGLSDLSTFQAKYDGARVTYPTTRDGQLSNFTINKDVATNQTNWLTFQRDNGGVGRITATSNNDFKNAKVGSTITVSGTSSNDGTYTIKSVDPTNHKYITVQTEMLTTRANDTGTGITLTGADGVTLRNGSFTDLSFARGAGTTAGTITAASGTPFSNLKAGETFTVANATDAANNSTFTIASVTPTVITIKEKKLTDEGGSGTESVNYTTGAGDVTFNDNNPNADTIVIANTTAGAEYAKLKAGMKITLSGAATGADNTTFTVGSIATSGNTVTITIAKNESLTDSGGADANAVKFLTTEAAGTVTATSYYKGDTVNPTHSIDSNRSFEFKANAIDPAFEKAMRAMSIIAQGAYGSEGGLDKNTTTRVNQARFLLSSTLDPTTSLTGATGTELDGNIDKVSMDISFNRVRIDSVTKTNKKFISFLDTQISKSEDVNNLEAITKLLDGSRSLEASYQALARIRKLSLANFL